MGHQTGITPTSTHPAPDGDYPDQTGITPTPDGYYPDHGRGLPRLRLQAFAEAVAKGLGLSHRGCRTGTVAKRLLHTGCRAEF